MSSVGQRSPPPTTHRSVMATLTPMRRLEVPQVTSPNGNMTHTPGGYTTAFQAGLSPSPFTRTILEPKSESLKGNHPNTNVTLQPDLQPDEQSWLQYVRNHELLPYIDNRKSAGGGSNSASASSSNLGMLDKRPGITSPQTPSGPVQQKSSGFALVLNKITGIRIPPHVESKVR